MAIDPNLLTAIREAYKTKILEENRNISQGTELPKNIPQNQYEENYQTTGETDPAGFGNILKNAGKAAFAFAFGPAISAYHESKEQQATDKITKLAINEIKKYPGLDPNTIAFNLQNIAPKDYEKANISQVMKNVMGITQGVQQFTENEYVNSFARAKKNKLAFDNDFTTPDYDFNTVNGGKGRSYYTKYAENLGAVKRLTADNKLVIDESYLPQIIKEAIKNRTPIEFVTDIFNTPIDKINEVLTEIEGRKEIEKIKKEPNISYSVRDKELTYNEALNTLTSKYNMDDPNLLEDDNKTPINTDVMAEGLMDKTNKHQSNARKYYEKYINKYKMLKSSDIEKSELKPLKTATKNTFINTTVNESTSVKPKWNPNAK